MNSLTAEELDRIVYKSVRRAIWHEFLSITIGLAIGYGLARLSV